MNLVVRVGRIALVPIGSLVDHADGIEPIDRDGRGRTGDPDQRALDAERLPQDFGAGESLVVFLRHGGRLIGLVRLSDKLEGHDFGDPERALAQKAAELASVALANSLKLRSLERRSFRDPTTKAYTLAFFEDVVRNEVPPSGRYLRLLREGARHHQLAADYREFLDAHAQAPPSAWTPWMLRLIRILDEPSSRLRRDALMWLFHAMARLEARVAPPTSSSKK